MSLQDQIDALPPTGGRIDLPVSITQLSAPLLINKPNVTLRGQGKGGFWLKEGATTLQGAGIIITGQRCVFEDFLLTGAQGDGIVNNGGGTVIKRVTVNYCKGAGVVTQGNSPTTADSWHYEDVESAFNDGDGFVWPGPCTDSHLGYGLLLSASCNGGVGFNIACGQKNEFHATLVQENKGGGYVVGSPNNYFFNAYAEEGVGSSFIIQPGVLSTHVWFDPFGQPQLIQDNSRTGANDIHFWGAGSTPAVNQVCLSSLDGLHGVRIAVDASGFRIWDTVNAKQVFPAK